MKRFAWMFVAVGSVLLALVAWAGWHWYTTPRYSTRTIPIFVLDASGAPAMSIFWLDNDRILFRGGDPTIVKVDESNKQEAVRPAAYIWDTRETTYRRHIELGMVGRMCYEGGTANYQIWNDTYPYRLLETLRGPVGQEQEVAPESSAEPRSRLWRLADLFGCQAPTREEAIAATHATADHKIIALNQGDGFLVAGEIELARKAATASDAVLLWVPGAATGITLPVQVMEFSTAYFTYSEYRKRYIIAAYRLKDAPPDAPDGFPAGYKRPVYYFDRSGHTEVRLFPDEDWVIRAQGFLPTRAGYLVASKFTRRAQSKDGGVWIVGDYSSTKLVDHVVEAFSVSPDGCKAIVSIFNPDLGRRAGRRMQVFDFCDTGSKE